MDSADLKNLQTSMAAQVTKIHQHATQLSTVGRGVEELSKRQEDFQASVTSQVNHLAGQLHQVLLRLDTAPPATPPAENPAAAPTGPVAPISLRLAPPEKFSGNSGDCRTFLVQCDLHFKLNPAAFESDQAKVAFIVSHLTGRAAAWATAEWSSSRSRRLLCGIPTFKGHFVSHARRCWENAASPRVEFSINNQTVTHGVLIDSGADESLMDWSLARQNQVKTIPLTHPVTASALDGRRLFRVTHCTEPIQINQSDGLETLWRRKHLEDEQRRQEEQRRIKKLQEEYDQEREKYEEKRKEDQIKREQEEKERKELEENYKKELENMKKKYEDEARENAEEFNQFKEKHMKEFEAEKKDHEEELKDKDKQYDVLKALKANNEKEERKKHLKEISDLVKNVNIWNLTKIRTLLDTQKEEIEKAKNEGEKEHLQKKHEEQISELIQTLVNKTGNSRCSIS
ncbi:hypothetical protein L3Q82_001622 [Scomber scombrus]|uniref:DUF4939 domain-containing protein n=1 Tax=Scomber scombrus TaxID=13677 RepID=A0AAV1QIN6_SCOSC